ncbi:MAG: M28 family peptidase [Bacteroidales bacterium]|nr:M28 family peptidase [Bacteroidales bacterium]
MRKTFILAALLFFISGYISFAQTNMKVSNPIAEQILLGNYNPANYTPSVIINNPDSIIQGIIFRISKDTLFKNLLKLQSYKNRNTGSDTIASTNGIGAVRRWLSGEFQKTSAKNENRLVVSYLDFDATISGKTKHRNVFAVLPGLDTTDKSFIIMLSHFDSRCESNTDTGCAAPGIDDNGSGTVMTLELARVMSKYAYNHTIVFAELTGEEQGLYGAKAMANYCYNKGMKILACINDDIVSGTICGQTASPPGCSPPGSIDSTTLRVFSFSTANDSNQVSPFKQLARYTKLQQIEVINPLINPKMEIEMQILEDRVGRGDDHQPFRQKGYVAIGFI